MNTKFVWTDPDRMSGQPCLRGTRIPVSQLLQEIIDDPGRMQAVADRFGLKIEHLRGMLGDVARWINEQQVEQVQSADRA